MGEELCVKRLAAVLCSEEEKGEEEGGSVSSCFVSANAVTQLKQAEHLAAMLGKGSRSQLCPSFFWAGSHENVMVAIIAEGRKSLLHSHLG